MPIHQYQITPDNLPVIGYENLLTRTTVAASDQDPQYPVSNLANSVPHLFWRPINLNSFYQITFTPATSPMINYIAMAGHNLGSAGYSVYVSGPLPPPSNATPVVLLHLDAADGSTIVVDSGTYTQSHTWTFSGTAQIDTAQSKFGGSSAVFDGTSLCCLTGNIGSDGAFGSGAFTVDFKLRLNATGTAQTYYDGGVGSASSATKLRVHKNTGNKVLVDSNGSTIITGTTSLTTGTWYHIAVTRSGTSTRLFVNGTQEGSTAVDSISYTNAGPTIGSTGAQGTISGERHNGWIDELRILKGFAAWTANFTAPTLAYSSSVDQTFATALLHFDGTNGSTAIVDDVGTSWVAVGNAQLDTSQQVFGSASLKLDGTGDYIHPTTNSIAFGLPGDFTIDFRVRFNVVSAYQNIFDSRDGVDGNYLTIYLDGGSNVLKIYSNGGDIIASSTVFTTGTWYHVALTRSGSSLRLFVNGTQEGGTLTNSVGFLPATNRPLIGINTFFGTDALNGWLDEFRIVAGIAYYTTNFTVPLQAYSVPVTLIPQTQVLSDAPVIFQFDEQSLSQVTVRLVGNQTSLPKIGVLFAGNLLSFQRSIAVNEDHNPLGLSFQTDVAELRSETGQFLGQTMLARKAVSKATIEHMEPDWYRDQFFPFANSAEINAFFFSWQPQTYPDEVGFVQTISDIAVEVDPVTRKVTSSIQMQGLV